MVCTEQNGPVHRYQEKFYFNPGDTGFKVFHTKFATIGVAICWDQWFPEAARAMALQGAEVRATAMHAAELACSKMRATIWVRMLCKQAGKKRRVYEYVHASIDNVRKNAQG